MIPLLAGFGGRILAWVGGAGALLMGGLLAAKSIKASGAADQRATDIQQARDDDAKASKARSTVDSLGDAAVDDQLRRFQRK